MEEIKSKLFWFRKHKQEEQLLIFWSGYPLGNIYVYQFRESLPATELKNLMEKHKGQCEIYDLNYPPTVVFSASEWEFLQRST